MVEEKEEEKGGEEEEGRDFMYIAGRGDMDRSQHGLRNCHGRNFF
jgi:hypothetical protein